MKTTLVLLAAAGAHAFPGMLGVSSREEALKMLMEKRGGLQDLTKELNSEGVSSELSSATSNLGLGLKEKRGKKSSSSSSLTDGLDLNSVTSELNLDSLTNELNTNSLTGLTSSTSSLGSLKEKRQGGVLGGVLGGLSETVGALTNDIAGLLGSVASAVDPDNKRPEPGYVFKAPRATDSRGPCPGLNLLANYGYLPRDGYVNFGQVLDATARGFNMGTDLATVLAVFATLTNANITTESFYLGTSAATHVGGLNRHDTVESDVSPNREDFYLGCGDNHHLSSRLFAQNVALAAQDPDQEFSLNVMGEQYALNAKFSQTYNPYLYYFPFPSIVSLAAFNFYPQFFSNGTYGAGGVANYESISSIIGAQFNKKTGHFEYVPERWPENWYRRATPYGAVQALSDALVYNYPKYPLPMAIPQLGTANVTPQTILCVLYEGINSITPLALGGSEEDAGATIAWALGKLADVGISGTILGCPTSAVSQNGPGLYPNATQKGGPLSEPPSVYKWTGNDVYNKVYFTEAPKMPICKHSSNR